MIHYVYHVVIIGLLLDVTIEECFTLTYLNSDLISLGPRHFTPGDEDLGYVVVATLAVLGLALLERTVFQIIALLVVVIIVENSPLIIRLIILIQVSSIHQLI